MRINAPPLGDSTDENNGTRALSRSAEPSAADGRVGGVFRGIGRAWRTRIDRRSASARHAAAGSVRVASERDPGNRIRRAIPRRR
eukprot:14356-Pelagococcus_subviridis.AAC.2